MNERRNAVTRIPVLAADCFLLAHDDFMHRTGQGRHVSQSILELASAPDLKKLRPALVRLVQKHPILSARLRRDWKTWLPFWEVPPPANGLPLKVWQEKGVSAAEPGAVEIDGAMDLLQRIINEPLADEGAQFQARFDVVLRANGSCLAALSWSHLLIDGKGAELLLAEIARLCEGQDVSCETAEPPAPPAASWKERLLKTKAAVIRLENLAKIGAPSLGGPQPRKGRGCYQNITLSLEDSARLASRVEQMVGALFPMTFYVACTARAHDRVFRQRGREPRGYVASVPVQTRKRGARGPLFHNRVSIFFFSAERADLGSIEAASLSIKQQFAEMVRAKLDASFLGMLELMVRLPARLFMRVVRWQFKGEIASFFHSHTGAFAPELEEFAGAKITNAWHLPCLGSPPGTGLFFCERAGRVNVTLTWREGAISDEERRLILAQVMEDLFGEPREDLLRGI